MKATSEQLDLRRRRIQAILQIRLDGAEVWDVCQHVADAEQAGTDPWIVSAGEKPLTAAQIQAIITAADKLIAESSPSDAPELARHKGKLRNLYARAVQAGDVRTARSILNDLAKLDGLTRRKPSAPAMPSKARTATEKLKAKLREKKKKVNHARQTPEADPAAHSGRDIPPGPPPGERAAPVAGDPSEAETPLEVCPPNVGPPD